MSGTAGQRPSQRISFGTGVFVSREGGSHADAACDRTGRQDPGNGRAYPGTEGDQRSLCFGDGRKDRRLPGGVPPVRGGPAGSELCIPLPVRPHLRRGRHGPHRGPEPQAAGLHPHPGRTGPEDRAGPRPDLLQPGCRLPEPHLRASLRPGRLQRRGGAQAHRAHHPRGPGMRPRPQGHPEGPGGRAHGDPPRRRQHLLRQLQPPRHDRPGRRRLPLLCHRPHSSG